MFFYISISDLITLLMFNYYECNDFLVCMYTDLNVLMFSLIGSVP